MTMTAAMAAALQDGNPRGLFAAIGHPSGTGYFTTGIGSRSWNGHTWAGTGQLGSISPLKHTSDIAIQDITFTLSGIDANVAAGLADDVQGYHGTVWLYCLASDDTVILDPYQIIDSVLDYQTLQIGADGTTTVAITAHAGFYTLARAVSEAWTPQNAKRVYPTETGFDMIPLLINQNLQWTPT
jgi:hypothetical protein